MEEITPITLLRERAARTLNTINTYLASFNGDGILVLFEDNTDKSKYLKRYSDFSLKLNDSLNFLEDSIVKISRLIEEYTKTKTIEETAELYSYFESGERFLLSVAKFIDDNERNFKSDAFNPAQTLGSTRELKSAAEILIKSING